MSLRELKEEGQIVLVEPVGKTYFICDPPNLGMHSSYLMEMVQISDITSQNYSGSRVGNTWKGYNEFVSCICSAHIGDQDLCDYFNS